MTKVRVLLLIALVAAVLFLTSCGGTAGTGGGIPQPAPTVTVTANPATITAGQTSTLTWSSANATSCTASGAWSGSQSMNGTKSVSPTATATYTLSCTGAGGMNSASATVTVNPVQQPLTVQFVQPPSEADTGTTVAFNILVTGGDGSGTTQAWTVNGVAGGNATVGTITNGGVYTTPALQPSPNTITIGVTVTEGTLSPASATTQITVKRVITVSVDPSSHLNGGNQITLWYGGIPQMYLDFTNVMVGDTMYSVVPWSTSTQATVVQKTLSNPVPILWFLDGPGPHDVAGLLKFWIVGQDGVQSNTCTLIYRGSQQMAVQRPSTREIYFDSGWAGIFPFTADGVPNATIISGGGRGIGVDDQTGYVFYARFWGLGMDDPATNTGNLISMGVGDISPNQWLAVDVGYGLACTLQPQTDSGNCVYASEALQSPPPLIALPLPAGSSPVAVKVIDNQHVVVYGAYDQTLRWFTISGHTAAPTMNGTAAATLNLGKFAAIQASDYWQGTVSLPGTWQIVNGTSGEIVVMGPASVNGDDQECAIVNTATFTQVGDYVKLPSGTMLIAPDPANGAITAEYTDSSGESPVSRFWRYYLGTGNSAALSATTPAPGVGFVISGSNIITFLPPNNVSVVPNQ